jgi:hypothetical protein
MMDAADPRLLKLLRIAARTASAAVAAIALLVLAGWQLEIELLRSLLHPGGIAMNPITAVAFLIAAAGLWVLTPEPLSYRRERVG